MQDDTTQQTEPETRESTVSTGICEAHTRFLYPFRFERRSIVPFVELITRQKFEGSVMWDPFDATNIANEYYRSETPERCADEPFRLRRLAALSAHESLSGESSVPALSCHAA